MPVECHSLEIRVSPSLSNAVHLSLLAALELSVSKQVLFVDAANAFNPYVVLKLSENRLIAQQCLQNILVSRPFTIHQLQRLLEEELLPASDRRRQAPVILLGLTQLFLDETVDEQERFRVLGVVCRQLHRLSTEQNLSCRIFLADNPFSRQLWGWLNGSDSSVVSHRDPGRIRGIEQVQESLG